MGVWDRGKLDHGSLNHGPRGYWVSCVILILVDVKFNIDEIYDSTVQYIRWSPTGHKLLWVKDNDIYFHDLESTSDYVKFTTGGEKNKIYNGVPDWVYEGILL